MGRRLSLRGRPQARPSIEARMVPPGRRSLRLERNRRPAAPEAEVTSLTANIVTTGREERVDRVGVRQARLYMSGMSIVAFSVRGLTAHVLCTVYVYLTIGIS